MPLARVVGVHFGLPDRKESPESFARRLKSRGTEDLLLAQDEGRRGRRDPGHRGGDRGDRLRFRYQDKSRTLPLEQVEGLVMAARPGARAPPDDRSPDFSLPAAVVSGRLEGPRHRRLEGRDGVGAGPEPPGRRKSRACGSGGAR